MQRLARLCFQSCLTVVLSVVCTTVRFFVQSKTVEVFHTQNYTTVRDIQKIGSYGTRVAGCFFRLRSTAVSGRADESLVVANSAPFDQTFTFTPSKPLSQSVPRMRFLLGGSDRLSPPCVVVFLSLCACPCVLFFFLFFLCYFLFHAREPHSSRRAPPQAALLPCYRFLAKEDEFGQILGKRTVSQCERGRAPVVFSLA